MHDHEIDDNGSCITCGAYPGTCCWCDYWGWLDSEGLCPDCADLPHDEDCKCDDCKGV